MKLRIKRYEVWTNGSSLVTNVWKMILKLNNDSVFVSWQLVKLQSNLLSLYYPSPPSSSLPTTMIKPSKTCQESSTVDPMSRWVTILEMVSQLKTRGPRNTVHNIIRALFELKTNLKRGTPEIMKDVKLDKSDMIIMRCMSYGTSLSRWRAAIQKNDNGLFQNIFGFMNESLEIKLEDWCPVFTIRSNKLSILI